MFDFLTGCKEILTPEQFINLTDDQRANIKSVDIIPPKLGGNHFGKILIKKYYPDFKKISTN